MPDRVKLRVVVMIQARMESTRLPGKTLLHVLDRPLLDYLTERLRAAHTPDTLVVLTTTRPADQAIVEFCREEGVLLFRGSAEDVLDRYYQAAKIFAADVIVRVTADCPLLDPVILDQVVGFYLDHYPDYDYVSNTVERTYPRGMDVEVFSYAALERAAKVAKRPEEREHVTLHMYRNPKDYRIGSFVQQRDQSQYRLTVDTEEDFVLITKILQALYVENPLFTVGDILKLLAEKSDWIQINANVPQKEVL